MSCLCLIPPTHTHENHTKNMYTFDWILIRPEYLVCPHMKSQLRTLQTHTNTRAFWEKWAKHFSNIVRTNFLCANDNFIIDWRPTNGKMPDTDNAHINFPFIWSSQKWFDCVSYWRGKTPTSGKGINLASMIYVKSRACVCKKKHRCPVVATPDSAEKI